MDTGISLWHIGFAAAFFIAGGLIGFFAGRASGSTRGRIGRLEGELRRERDRYRDYQEAVAIHFGKSSDLFRDLTHKYTTLYGHLAAGARDLCADRMRAMGRSFDDSALLGVESRGDSADPKSDGSVERKEDEAVG